MRTAPHAAKTVMDRASKLFFAIAAFALFALALSLLGVAVWQLGSAYLSPDQLLMQTLESIGLVTIAVAVFDVGKFLIEEEVLRDREMGSIREARQSMTKFFTIIIIALALESIVLVLETKMDDVSQVIFPTALMAVVVLALVGLGAFRKLTDEGKPAPALDVDAQLEDAARRARR